MTDHTRLILSLQSYLSQASLFLLAFGLVFETPILVFLLCLLGVVKAKTFARYRKYVVLGIFVVAAVITPTPDAFNQSLVAIPMYLLFELGVLAGRIAERRKARRDGPGETPR
jgi:sec-independent protein translocase protein TatC